MLIHSFIMIPNLGNIWSISVGYLGDFLEISQGYLEDIWGYLEDVLGMY